MLEKVRNMDKFFVCNYIIIPIIIGWCVANGRKNKNHNRLGFAYCFKSMFYFYCADANILNYINKGWEVRHIAGFAIALAIMEGFCGMVDCTEEYKKNTLEKFNVKK